MTPTLQVLLLTARAQLHILQLATDAPLASLQATIGSQRMQVENLGYGIDLWRDLEAAIKPDPRLNAVGMWLCQHLRSPIQVPVIYGSVVLTGNINGRISSLADDPLNALHQTLTTEAPAS